MQLGPYRIVRRLATGGMAEVLLARLGRRPLALKRLLPHLAGSDEMVALFEKEARIAAGVCEALQHAHELGVVHGDVSPSNILLGFDGSVKLCDFGIAGRPGLG